LTRRKGEEGEEETYRINSLLLDEGLFGTGFRFVISDTDLVLLKVGVIRFMPVEGLSSVTHTRYR